MTRVSRSVSDFKEFSVAFSLAATGIPLAQVPNLGLSSPKVSSVFVSHPWKESYHHCRWILSVEPCFPLAKPLQPSLGGQPSLLPLPSHFLTGANHSQSNGIDLNSDYCIFLHRFVDTIRCYLP